MSDLHDEIAVLHEALADAMDRINDLENEKAALELELAELTQDRNRWMDVERYG